MNTLDELEEIKELVNNDKHFKYKNIVNFNCESIEKTLKALEIIKKKKVDMWHLADLLEQTYEMYVAFCKSEKYEEDYILTEEEFEILNEGLK